MYLQQILHLPYREQRRWTSIMGVNCGRCRKHHRRDKRTAADGTEHSRARNTSAGTDARVQSPTGIFLTKKLSNSDASRRPDLAWFIVEGDNITFELRRLLYNTGIASGCTICAKWKTLDIIAQLCRAEVVRDLRRASMFSSSKEGKGAWQRREEFDVRTIV